MVVLNVYKLDEDKGVLASFKNGEHTLGRGSQLNCDDQRISRSQAVLKVHDVGASIMSIHVRPCFYISANGQSVTILPKDTPVDLNDGDKFAFLPDKYWFKIEIQKEHSAPENAQGFKTVDLDVASPSHTNNRNKAVKFETFTGKSEKLPPWLVKKTLPVQTVESISYDIPSDVDADNPSHVAAVLKDIRNGKHKINQNSESSPAKIAKLEEFSTSTEELPVNNEVNCEKPATSEVLSESDQDEVEPSASSSLLAVVIKNENHIDSATIKTEVDVDDGNEASGSGVNGSAEAKKIRRSRCWYGSSCYRKNPAHRKDYSHPDDSDYESDKNDNRPLCPYGNKCYRRNKDHQKEYRHNGDDGAGAKKPKKEKGRVAASKEKKQPAYYESPVDDYDLEDPFIDDASEDEYVADSGSSISDSDYDEDLKSVEEDDTKRLIKEARRFTRAKRGN